MFEIGRTFGIVQYDKKNSLKVIAKDLCKTIWRIVDASSTDWTLPESRKCWKCAKDLVLPIARIDWLEVDIGISNVHVVCENMRNG